MFALFSSRSWGPDDDGRTVDGPHPLGKVGSHRKHTHTHTHTQTHTQSKLVLAF